MVDPTNVFAMDDIKFMTGFNIEPVVASESSIMEGIEKAYSTSASEEDLEQGHGVDDGIGERRRRTAVRRAGDRTSPNWRRRRKKRPSSSW